MQSSMNFDTVDTEMKCFHYFMREIVSPQGTKFLRDFAKEDHTNASKDS